MPGAPAPARPLQCVGLLACLFAAGHASRGHSVSHCVEVVLHAPRSLLLVSRVLMRHGAPGHHARAVESHNTHQCAVGGLPMALTQPLLCAEPRELARLCLVFAGGAQCLLETQPLPQPLCCTVMLLWGVCACLVACCARQRVLRIPRRIMPCTPPLLPPFSAATRLLLACMHNTQDLGAPACRGCQALVRLNTCHSGELLLLLSVVLRQHAAPSGRVWRGMQPQSVLTMTATKLQAAPTWCAALPGCRSPCLLWMSRESCMFTSACLTSVSCIFTCSGILRGVSPCTRVAEAT